MELNIHFEKEAVLKKKLYEQDIKSEHDSFELFSKQLKYTKLKNTEKKSGNKVDTETEEKEISKAKEMIEETSKKKEYIQKNLDDLEKKREILMTVTCLSLSPLGILAKAFGERNNIFGLYL
jgi:translation initiation factor 2B subunit (eIF-2B alpha/beta/delta family)